MPQSDPSRTEKATPKQRDKARKKGQVARSQELGKTMVLLAGVVTLRYLIEFIYKHMREIFQWLFTEGMTLEMTTQVTYELFIWLVQKMALMVIPLMIVIFLVAIITLRIEVGPLWTTQTMQPKFSKFFNIVGGLQKLMFSMSSFVRLLRSIAQAVAVGFAPYIVIRQEFDNFLPMFYADIPTIASYILLTGYKMVCYALIPMLLIAIADVIYSRWDYEEQLKMTKDEIKDERKQSEGDPKIKAAQQRKMMMVMAQRMMQEVPKADVIVTNPTHYAVALRYDVMVAPAPMVLAKGVNNVALRIKEIAKENNIPIRENKALAQALYKQVEIGETIPEELYQAVAAILARLENFQRKPG